MSNEALDATRKSWPTLKRLLGYTTGRRKGLLIAAIGMAGYAAVDTYMLSLIKPLLDEETNREAWKAWQHGLSKRITLAEKLPPLRMLLIWDNLQGHYTPELVLWLFAQGVMLLFTPLAGSWLNMAESIQRILVRRALSGQTGAKSWVFEENSRSLVWVHPLISLYSR